MAETNQNTDSLANFKRNTAAFLQRLHRTGKPVVLTLHGKAKLVVQDVRTYKELLALVDRLETIEGIRKGLEDMDAGRGRPAEEVFEEIRRKFRIAQAK